MKFLKWTLIVIAILALLGYFIGWPYMKGQTKKHSPETVAKYNQNGMDLAVTYSSPSKKDRVIFGELVPYGKVWRTGANEPTSFTTKTDIKIIDKPLPAGTYALWTIPDKDSWKIIFNKELPEWGVTILSGGKETTRNPETDVLQVEVPVKKLSEVQENFKIDFLKTNPPELTLSWDSVMVSVPINE